jgi:hypothetical protein
MTDQTASKKEDNQDIKMEEPSDAGSAAVSPTTVEGPSEKVPKKEGIPLEKRRMTKSTALVIALVIIAALITAAYLTIGIEQFPSTGEASYPYSTTYDVLFPDGKQVFIGSTSITALTYQDEVIVDVDGDRERMLVGEDRLISQRRAIIRTLGIPVVDTQYQIYIRFLGASESQIHFNLTLKTSRQVPQFLIERILPPEIHARPV